MRKYTHRPGSVHNATSVGPEELARSVSLSEKKTDYLFVCIPGMEVGMKFCEDCAARSRVRKKGVL